MVHCQERPCLWAYSKMHRLLDVILTSSRAGTGTAGIIVPFLMQWLLDSYGFRTALRVWAVVMVCSNERSMSYCVDPFTGYFNHTLPLRIERSTATTCCQHATTERPVVSQARSVLGISIWQCRAKFRILHPKSVSS